MDEDILDALFLQFIGIKWSVKFKNILRTFFDSHAWKPASQAIPKRDLERRQYFLYEDPENPENRGRASPETCLDERRRHMFANDYFMSQLPSSETESAPNYEDAIWGWRQR